MRTRLPTTHRRLQRSTAHMCTWPVRWDRTFCSRNGGEAPKYVGIHPSNASCNRTDRCGCLLFAFELVSWLRPFEKTPLPCISLQVSSLGECRSLINLCYLSDFWDCHSLRLFVRLFSVFGLSQNLDLKWREPLIRTHHAATGTRTPCF